jgi:hypothetical protein
VKSGSLKMIAEECFPHLKKHHLADGSLSADDVHESERRRLHEGMDPVATELFELFEEVHMMIFYVMVAFICLCFILLLQAQITKKKFVLCENAKLSDFLRGNVGSLTWKERFYGGHRLLQDAVEYRLVRREFFHPWDEAQRNQQARPASFDFAEYLSVCMSDMIVELVEIPSTSFVALFAILVCCKPIFMLSHYGRERFMVCFAWGIALILFVIMCYVQRIYYEMLPAYAKNLKEYFLICLQRSLSLLFSDLVKQIETLFQFLDCQHRVCRAGASRTNRKAIVSYIWLCERKYSIL